MVGKAPRRMRSFRLLATDADFTLSVSTATDCLESRFAKKTT
ncbi:hypothetical protein NY78_2237 [Desulfovibrio sp. TomC]|nr:hypothetical protein NY78_2237 [Desulfovibrio sp. TomC]